MKILLTVIVGIYIFGIVTVPSIVCLLGATIAVLCANKMESDSDEVSADPWAIVFFVSMGSVIASIVHIIYRSVL